MSVQGKMAIRMGIYVILVGYLLLDLFVFQGPVKKGLMSPDADSPEVIAAARAKGIVARVYAQPIYGAQLEERVKEKLWMRGRKVEEVSLAERKILRFLALQELIDERLVKVQIKVSAQDEYEITEEEVDQAVARFEKRYGDAEALKKAVDEQGWQGEKELRYRVAARLQRERYFQKEIEPEVVISEDEAREWYDRHGEKLALPHRRRVRHVFIAALDHPENEAKALIEAARKRVIEGGEDFGKVASECSEDLKSKKLGGDLGWMAKGRVMEEFTTKVFNLPIGEPRVIRTELGWHLVEVLEEKEEAKRSYEEVEQEVREALAVELREEKIRGYRSVLRHYAAGKIDIYEEVLYEGMAAGKKGESSE